MLAKSSPLFVKDFGAVKLVMDNDGQTWLLWTLTEKQQRFLGLEIFPLTCFWKYDLCEQHLKRPHLTCFTCKLRLVVSGKLPFTYPVTVHQVWSTKNKSKLRTLLFKEAMSFAEVLS